jgi:O-acetyl-ADP-ribose deacetylase (regulator of RNase III)
MPGSVSGPVQIGRCTVRLVRDDITQLQVDAFVFYARPDLALGSGFGTAISQRGGPSIQKELKEFGPVETGQAVVTGAGHLPAGYIVHAVGPRFNEPETEGKLRTTVFSALQAAEQKGVKRIALPPMGAGFYAVPLELCARVMIEAIQSYLQGRTDLQEVVLCVADQREYTPFASQLALLNSSKDEIPA